MEKRMVLGTHYLALMDVFAIGSNAGHKTATVAVFQYVHQGSKQTGFHVQINSTFKEQQDVAKKVCTMSAKFQRFVMVQRNLAKHFAYVLFTIVIVQELACELLWESSGVDVRDFGVILSVGLIQRFGKSCDVA
jgi:hypothetical protein